MFDTFQTVSAVVENLDLGVCSCKTVTTIHRTYVYCGEPYKNSTEPWIQCQACFKWAHNSCAGVDEEDINFVCESCTD